jgi:hypothetical protein
MIKQLLSEINLLVVLTLKFCISLVSQVKFTLLSSISLSILNWYTFSSRKFLCFYLNICMQGFIFLTYVLKFLKFLCLFICILSVYLPVCLSVILSLSLFYFISISFFNLREKKKIPSGL